MDHRLNQNPTAVPLPFPFDRPFPILPPPIPIPPPLIGGVNNLLHPPIFSCSATTPSPFPFFHHHHREPPPHPHNQHPFPAKTEDVPLVATATSGPADVLEDWSMDVGEEEDGEVVEVLVMNDEWIEFFAKSEAKRKADKKKKKQQQRKKSN